VNLYAQFMSEVISILVWIFHHQHFLVRHYSHRPRFWLRIEQIRADTAWLLQHMKSSNRLRPLK